MANIPGTTRLVDTHGSLSTPHAAQSSKRDVILVPTPSSDPDDPLNWSRQRKSLSCLCMCAYTLTVGIASSAIYSVLEPISQATQLTLNDLNSGTGYMFLAFGWSCLLWQPLAFQYGKRPVFLFSVLATSMIQVWAPYTKTNGEWIANKVLQGFFGAPIESLCEIWVADIYFQHERGTYIALYGLLLCGSNYFAPLISGFITDGQGWQWVLYWCAIFNAVCFIFLFFFMEETNYPGRIPSTYKSQSLASPVSPSSLVNSLSDLETKGLKPRAADEYRDEKLASSTKSFASKLSLVHKRSIEQPNRLLEMAWRPLVLLTFPVISWCGFAYGAGLVWFNVLNGSASLILTSPPYNFRPSLVGLAYISPLISVLIAHLYCGPFGDRFAIWLARRRGGYLESEFRLWLFLPCLLLVPGGLILYGVGAAHGIHWIGPVIAMGIIAAMSFAALQLALAYCLDTYYALCNEAVVTVILVRNSMSFAVGYGLTPWIENMGLQNAFLVAAFVGLAVTATFLFLTTYGKRLRQANAGRYERYVAQAKRDVVVEHFAGSEERVV